MCSHVEIYTHIDVQFYRVYIRIHMHVQLHIQVHMYVQLHIQVHVYVKIYIHLNSSIDRENVLVFDRGNFEEYFFLHTNSSTHIYTRIYTHKGYQYMSMYGCKRKEHIDSHVCTCTCMHTHTHTNAHARDDTRAYVSEKNALTHTNTPSLPRTRTLTHTHTYTHTRTHSRTRKRTGRRAH